MPSRPATPRSPSTANGIGRPRLVLVAFWLAIAAFVPKHWSTLGAAFQDPDDAMRLVEVRDFLGGQGWFDLRQHRLDPAANIASHWSRIVDAPIALLMKAFALISAPGVAEKLAMIVWPLLLLLAAFSTMTKAAQRLAGPAATLPALLLMATCTAATWQFLPGRIDHHNVQVVLALGVLTCALHVGSRRAAALAGGLTALAIGTGLESLPFLAVGAASYAIRLAMDVSARTEAKAFAVSLLASTLAVFAGTTAPARYGTASCDALGANTVLLVATAAIGLVAVVVVAPRLGSRARWFLLGLTGLLALGAYGWLEPACLHGPFGQIDPALRRAWLDNVAEVQPWSWLWTTNRAAAVVDVVTPPLGLAALAVLWAGAPRPMRIPLACYGLALFLSFVIGCIQIRVLFYANVFAVPLVAAATVVLAGRLHLASPVVPIATAVSVGLFPIGVARLLSVQAPPDRESACLVTSSYAALARERAGLVAAFIDSGPVILSATRHSVLAGPYHRNARGILDTADIFTAPPERAAMLLKRRNVEYLAYCGGSEYVDFYRTEAPDGLAAVLARGERPAWLVPIGGANDPVVAFRVVLP